MEIRQPQYLLAVEKRVVIIYAATKGFLTGGSRDARRYEMICMLEMRHRVCWTTPPRKNDDIQRQGRGGLKEFGQRSGALRVGRSAA